MTRRISSYSGPGSVDQTDAHIISLLQVDARQPNTEIARKLGLAEATVRKRIERLLQTQIIRPGIWADPLKLGYQHFANIEIQVRPADIDRAAASLARLPEIFFLGASTGNCDIFAAALFRSNDHLHQFITKGLGAVPGIQHVITSSITRIIKREHAFLVVDEPHAVGGARAEGRARRPRARAARPRGKRAPPTPLPAAAGS